MARQVLRSGRAALLAGAYCFAAPSLSATETRTVSIESNVNNWPVAAVTINGTPTEALLDTGATIPLINHDYIPGEARPDWTSMQTRVLGIGGQRIYRVTTLTQLSVGREVWKDVRAAVNTESRFPVDQNILPISLFGSDIVDFDFANSEIHFYEGRPKRLRGMSRATIAYQEEDGLIYIPIEINGISGLALIDTGADRTFVNEAYSDLAESIPMVLDDQEMKGADLTRKVAEMHTFRRLKFGKTAVRKFHVPVLRTDLFKELGFGDGPMMVMGMDLLHHFRIQIDRRQNTVTFISPGQEQIRRPLRDPSATMRDLAIR